MNIGANITFDTKKGSWVVTNGEYRFSAMSFLRIFQPGCLSIAIFENTDKGHAKDYFIVSYGDKLITAYGGIGQKHHIDPINANQLQATAHKRLDHGYSFCGALHIYDPNGTIYNHLMDFLTHGREMLRAFRTNKLQKDATVVTKSKFNTTITISSDGFMVADPESAFDAKYF